MLSLRRITRSHRVQRATGVAAAHYLRFVWQTTRLTIEPPDAVERIVKQVPIILAMWHGQHFLTPFIRPKGRITPGKRGRELCLHNSYAPG